MVSLHYREHCFLDRSRSWDHLPFNLLGGLTGIAEEDRHLIKELGWAAVVITTKRILRWLERFDTKIKNKTVILELSKVLLIAKDWMRF